MKIKILKDIPGIIENTIFIPDKEGKIHVYGNTYKVKMLLDSGWAEEIKNEIDIEAIRKSLKITLMEDGIGTHYDPIAHPERDKPWDIEVNEIEFFTAYRVVKKVIDILNGDWKPDWEGDNYNKYYIRYDWEDKEFTYDSVKYISFNIFPVCKDNSIAQKVIGLCESELKILFDIK